MWKSGEGTTARLLQLCGGYFFFYVITGVTVKYFLGSEQLGMPHMDGLEFLIYSTLGGTLIASGVVLVLRWYRLESNARVRVLGMNLPIEFLYILPSGVCTAVIIPATTLMYTLPISVMVAMVIMRGCVIVISLAVDGIQIYQGILQRKVYFEELIAVVFAIAAVSTTIFWSGEDEKKFDFIKNAAAMSIMGSYVFAYAIRIYIMNYFKNTRGKGIKQDNKGFFGVEQLAACFTLTIAALVIYFAPDLFGAPPAQVITMRAAMIEPHEHWIAAVFAGMAFGAVAFFSVFIFMFKGRTATFAGLVNRLTSLVAGTVATVYFWLVYDPSKKPKMEDWISLGFILVAVYFLTIAERKRTAELIAAREIQSRSEEPKS